MNKNRTDLNFIISNCFEINLNFFFSIQEFKTISFLAFDKESCLVASFLVSIYTNKQHYNLPIYSYTFPCPLFIYNEFVDEFDVEILVSFCKYFLNKFKAYSEIYLRITQDDSTNNFVEKLLKNGFQKIDNCTFVFKKSN